MLTVFTTLISYDLRKHTFSFSQHGVYFKMTSSFFYLFQEKNSGWEVNSVYSFIIKLHIRFAEVRVYISWYVKPQNTPQRPQNKLAEILFVAQDIWTSYKMGEKIQTYHNNVVITEWYLVLRNNKWKKWKM